MLTNISKKNKTLFLDNFVGVLHQMKKMFVAPGVLIKILKASPSLQNSVKFDFEPFPNSIVQ